jgi:glycosyltransferase involved in cell wall biosynthesis
MSAPLISFVLPCYNYAQYLPDCLDSIFGQEGAWDFEIIAVDDASTDNTQEVLKSFADERLRVITHETNRGHAVTVNDGLRAARGQFIARIDPDDRYRRHFLKLTMEKFEQYPEVGLVYGNAAMIDAQGNINAERCDRAHGGKDFKGNELVRLLEWNFICAPTVIARREAWQQAGPVPEWLAFHDWFFTVMMARRWEFYYLDNVLADYRVHGANHHTMVTVKKIEEPSIFWVLEQVFSTPEQDAALETAKQRARRRIYAAQYLDMAEKYFGCNYNEDARRCYRRAFRHRPAFLWRGKAVLHWAATLVGRGFYEALKSGLKTARLSD